jgi:hypothetical protein
MHVVRHAQALRMMPSGAVEDQHNLLLGLGSAITTQPLSVARDLGFRLGTLRSSAIG